MAGHGVCTALIAEGHRLLTAARAAGRRAGHASVLSTASMQITAQAAARNTTMWRQLGVRASNAIGVPGWAHTCPQLGPLSRLPPPLSARPRLPLGSASMHLTLYPASCRVMNPAWSD